MTGRYSKENKKNNDTNMTAYLYNSIHSDHLVSVNAGLKNSNFLLSPSPGM
jgi:hypothetical protein